MKKTFPVVMLPTKKAEDSIVISAGRAWTFKGFFTQDYLKSQNKQSNHLYIISDDEIKEGDWYINNNVLFRAEDKFDEGNNPNQNKKNKKIVVTTDNSLNNKAELSKYYENGIGGAIKLPQLPESFIQAYIKAYNEGKPITEVDLEMEIGNWEHHDNVHRRCVNCNTINHKLDEYNCVCTKNVKTRPDNTVIVHQSKMYSKAEVIKLLLEAPDGLEIHDWIKTHLK